MKILIVDDSKTDLSTINQALSGIDDIQTFFATNADEAINIAIDVHPDLIILDVVMPNMDGIELRGRLSRHSYTADIPVVFVTASGCEVERDCFRIGCIEFLTKPIDMTKLIDIVVKQSFVAKIDDLIRSGRKLRRSLG